MTDDSLSSDKVALLLAGLRKEYLARLPAELEALEKLAHGLGDVDADRPLLDEIHQRLHKLTGSGGTFGFSDLSAQTRVLEHRVQAWVSGPMQGLDDQLRQEFMLELGKLKECLSKKSSSIVPAPVVHTRVEQTPGKVLNIWLVEDDNELGRWLSCQLETFNYAISLFTRLADAEAAAQNGQPDLLILDVLFDEEGKNSTQILDFYPNLKKMSCPLFFISAMDDFQSRIRAVKLGAVGYILKPLDVPRLVGRMAEVIERRNAPPQRVLIVDDDVDLSAHYRLALLAAGMEVEILHQSEHIIEKISVFRPELVLMDMHMLDYSGADLAGVIRQYDNLKSLPIVYLSAETDLDRQIEAMSRGADDFLTKPISDRQLVAAVNTRVGRARYHEGQENRDSLTGLLNHASIKEAIVLEVLRARRTGKPVSVAMLDIDHFKKVNDTYGHAAGDLVISAVGLLLRQRIRQSDVAGRYGGEEFAVVLQDCDEQNAHLLLENIRQSFANVHFNHEGKEFSCTLSAGLACSLQYPGSSGTELLIASDEALYAAKHGGRNQIRIASARKNH